MSDRCTLRQLQLTDPSQLDAIVELWNETVTAEFHISAKFARYNATTRPGLYQAGQWAVVDGKIAGVILASTLQGHPQVASPTSGWLDLIAVHPRFQHQGIGSSLLAWAEAWLLEQECQTVAVGGGVQPFLPGLPTLFSTTPFFQYHNYAQPHTVWDLAADLAMYEPPEIVRPIEGVVRPAQPRDANRLATFLQREFPGRWQWGAQHLLEQAEARISDYMLLWTEQGVEGFCRVTLEDSYMPIERFYPYQLPRPWGQLGPVGVSRARRGQGFGAALIDASLRRLHNNGVNGCVIDWTTLISFYKHFGFEPHHEYLQLEKTFVN